MRCEICNWCPTTNDGLDEIHASYQGNRVRYYPKTGRTVCGACLSIEKKIRIDYENERHGNELWSKGESGWTFAADLEGAAFAATMEDADLIDTEDVQENTLTVS